MSDTPTWITWVQLKKMGWPYSRFHTCGRMVREGRFPQPLKFGTHRSCRIAWRWEDVRPFFEKPV